MDQASDELTSQSSVLRESSAEPDIPAMGTSARALETTPSNATRATAEENDRNLEARGATASRPDLSAQGPVIVKDVPIDPEFEVLEVHDKEEGALVVDVDTPERYFWTDPITTLKREIWRPGDGDGDRVTDYFEKPGPPAPLEERWRFYQSRTGPGHVKHMKNVPPKYVILDDRAAYEVYISDIPRAHLTRYWQHDFGGNGVIRARRPNRGRGAIGDFEAEGRDRFHFGTIATRKSGERYYFTGEDGYNPIIWNTNDYHLAIEVFKPEPPKIFSPPPKEGLKWNQHGHNQFTPKDQLVKFGAPKKGMEWWVNKEPPKKPEGEVRGGRNRVPPLTATALASSSPPARDTSIERWRQGTTISRESSREASVASVAAAGYEGREGAKKRKLEALEAYENADEGESKDAYITYMETCVVESKTVTDEQKDEIESLQAELAESKKRIEKLEGVVAGLLKC